MLNRQGAVAQGILVNGGDGAGGGVGPSGWMLLHQCFGSFWRQPAFDSDELNALLQMLHALLVCVVAPQPVAFIAAAHCLEGGSFLSTATADTTVELG